MSQIIPLAPVPPVVTGRYAGFRITPQHFDIAVGIERRGWRERWYSPNSRSVRCPGQPWDYSNWSDGSTGLETPAHSSWVTSLTDAQRQDLDSVWRAFDERNEPYVVLRGYGELPESVEGSDVDVLVADEAFEQAVAYSRGAFERTGTGR